jgi:hypothetical protein
MTAPRTRKWSANELLDFVHHRYHLKVTGEVETPATNLLPKLTEHVPQGFNPRIFLLDLTIVKTAEIGAPLEAFRNATYDRPTTGNEFDEVDILFDGQIIEHIKVGHPKSETAAKKPAARKAVKKKPAKKKAPAKKKGAKKAAKKVAKKSTKKKSAKKTKARAKK